MLRQSEQFLRPWQFFDALFKPLCLAPVTAWPAGRKAHGPAPGSIVRSTADFAVMLGKAPGKIICHAAVKRAIRATEQIHMPDFIHGCIILTQRLPAGLTNAAKIVFFGQRVMPVIIMSRQKILHLNK